MLKSLWACYLDLCWVGCSCCLSFLDEETNTSSEGELRLLNAFQVIVSFLLYSLMGGTFLSNKMSQLPMMYWTSYMLTLACCLVGWVIQGRSYRLLSWSSQPHHNLMFIHLDSHAFRLQHLWVWLNCSLFTVFCKGAVRYWWGNVWRYRPDGITCGHPVWWPHLSSPLHLNLKIMVRWAVSRVATDSQVMPEGQIHLLIQKASWAGVEVFS